MFVTTASRTANYVLIIALQLTILTRIRATVRFVTSRKAMRDIPAAADQQAAADMNNLTLVSYMIHRNVLFQFKSCTAFQRLVTKSMSRPDSIIYLSVDY